MSAYPTLPTWGRRFSVVLTAGALALAIPTAAVADNDGHGNGNGRGHESHGNGNGWGHDKDGKPGKGNNGNNGNGHGKDKDKGPKQKPCDGPDHDRGCGNDKDKDKPGKGPDKPCDGPDKNKGCGNDKPKHDDRPSNTTVVNVQPASPSNSAPAFVVGSSNTPRSCLSRRYLRLNLSRTYNARNARVLLNGKAVPLRRSKGRVSALIDLRRRAKGTYTVRIAVVTKRGNIRTATRKFRTCTPKGTPRS